MTTDNNPKRTKYQHLDALLKEWHEENREAAMRKRDEILSALTSETGKRDSASAAHSAASHRPSHPSIIWSFLMHRYTRLAAAIMILVALAAILFPPIGEQAAYAHDDGVIMLPEGGRLDAFDQEGNLIGPCPLQHTDVAVNISAHFARVNVTQRYVNTYDRKIEAIYTFPLSNRGAVDRMTMTIGDRVVIGEVKERRQARQIYEAARDQGYVASLLEQERPNIFTQSVANIEPGAEVLIEISYVEVLQSLDGEYRFDFPMVVAPRYIPGYPEGRNFDLPEELQMRRGVVLLGPANIQTDGSVSVAVIERVLAHSMSINQPPAAWWSEERPPELLHQFTARYVDGAQEIGVIYPGGVGQVNGRWFHFDPKILQEREGEPGGAFSRDTDQVPDASRITPMPVRPDMRAGHTISVTVNIDTGGPEIIEVKSPQHEIERVDRHTRRAAPAPRASFALKKHDNIPNRDFLLTWRTSAETIEEAVFTHTGEYGEYSGGFFTFILNPPARVEDEFARPRELIFVLDNSGSMLGSSARLADGVSALEAAKRVITRAIDTMRPNDRFNVISFSSTLDVLWDEPRANTPQNRIAAQRYVEQRQGGGGTEMRNAVLKALEVGEFERPDRPKLLSPMELANLPADGREVRVLAASEVIRSGQMRRTESGCEQVHYLHILGGPSIEMCLLDALPGAETPANEVKLTGRWITEAGRRLLVVDRTEAFDRDAQDDLMRIVLFATDGLVGNDDSILQAVRENAGRSRVFTIGMSRSPNRHLLDEMAIAGRGAADYVLPDEDVDPIVARFAERIATPVLTDIRLEFSPELNVLDAASDGEGGFFAQGADRLPDLFDMQPLVIHGRYQPGEEAARGTVTIRGRTGAGPYVRVLDVELPAHQPEHDVIATLWARSKVGQLSRSGHGDARPIIALGEAFQIMTQYTSFVAVEKSRITVGGKPVLVRVPIEFPKDMSWEGIFGPDRSRPADDDADRWLVDAVRGAERSGHVQAGASAPGRAAGSSGGRFAGSGRVAEGREERVVASIAVPREMEGEARRRAEPSSPARFLPPTEMSPPPPPPSPASMEPPPPPARRATTPLLGDIPMPDSQWLPADARRFARGRVSEPSMRLRDDMLGLHFAGTLDDALLASVPIDFRDSTLDEILTFTQQTAGVAITPNWEALEAIGITPESKVTLSLPDAPAIAVIELVMRRAAGDDDFTIAVREGALHITTGEVEDGFTLDMSGLTEDVIIQRELHRRLDAQLIALLEAKTTGEVIVTVLVSDLEEATLAPLKEAGLTIETRSERGPFVVGRVDLARLERMAMLGGVRRVELVE